MLSVVLDDAAIGIPATTKRIQNAFFMMASCSRE
jgi:hypothetical protein